MEAESQHSVSSVFIYIHCFICFVIVNVQSLHHSIRRNTAAAHFTHWETKAEGSMMKPSLKWNQKKGDYSRANILGKCNSCCTDVCDVTKDFLSCPKSLAAQISKEMVLNTGQTPNKSETLNMKWYINTWFYFHCSRNSWMRPGQKKIPRWKHEVKHAAKRRVCLKILGSRGQSCSRAQEAMFARWPCYLYVRGRWLRVAVRTGLGSCPTAILFLVGLET